MSKKQIPPTVALDLIDKSIDLAAKIKRTPEEKLLNIEARKKAFDLRQYKKERRKGNKESAEDMIGRFLVFLGHTKGGEVADAVKKEWGVFQSFSK